LIASFVKNNGDSVVICEASEEKRFLKEPRSTDFSESETDLNIIFARATSVAHPPFRENAAATI
jgi:hypothetical protein